MDKETLDYEIPRCVDRGLGNCGQSLRHSAYWQLLVVFNLKASDIPTSPEVFSRNQRVTNGHDEIAHALGLD